MNTENETGVKVPKGQINYNTVAGSLGLAAFAGLGLRNCPAVPDPNASTSTPQA